MEAAEILDAGVGLRQLVTLASAREHCIGGLFVGDSRICKSNNLIRIR